MANPNNVIIISMIIMVDPNNVIIFTTKIC
jgi:hypothetical protein